MTYTVFTCSTWFIIKRQSHPQRDPDIGFKTERKEKKHLNKFQDHLFSNSSGIFGTIWKALQEQFVSKGKTVLFFTKTRCTWRQVVDIKHSFLFTLSPFQGCLDKMLTLKPSPPLLPVIVFYLSLSPMPWFLLHLIQWFVSSSLES